MLLCWQPSSRALNLGKLIPLAVGKAAMDHGDYAGAQTFFAKYADENPNDIEAWYDLGGAELALKKPADAAKAYEKCIALRSDAWGAHENLALAYAETENWVAFDKERALIKAARDAKTMRTNPDEHDLIDVLQVGDKRYEVWYYYTLHGHFHVRYVAIFFGKDGKAEDWLQAESDDADQGMFQSQHPKEAAAAVRVFSLDTYHSENGGYPSQGLIKFYQGEPTYEDFRKDVLASLNRKIAPSATVSPGSGKEVMTARTSEMDWSRVDREHGRTQGGDEAFRNGRPRFCARSAG